MRVHTRCHSAQLPFLLGGLVLLTACHKSGQLSTGLRPASSPASEVISEAEIADSHATTAYEAIQLSRPLFLTSKLDAAPLAEREVYLNGTRLGGIGELRAIPASYVREIRFVRGIDAAASGIGRACGAIIVISKVGR